jgi:curved DNA-binding protein CbpA
LKNYYELLGVTPEAPFDEIKRAFRKEIARYHPDKVQHLGTEFQEIAAVRAAELTEAYRILMDEGERQRYDDLVKAAGGAATAAPAPTRPAPDTPVPTQESEEPRATRPPSGKDTRFDQERANTSAFVKRVVVAKLREAVAAVAAGSPALTVAGFDAAYGIKAKGGLFKKGEPAVRLLVKFVPQVDAEAVAEAWPLALRAASDGNTICLLLLGGGIAPTRELSTAISEQRRKSRGTSPILVPVDVRDWEALFPPDAPASVRSIVQWLRDGNG